jgi:hypothetical protein
MVFTKYYGANFNEVGGAMALLASTKVRQSRWIIWLSFVSDHCVVLMHIPDINEWSLKLLVVVIAVVGI